MTFDDLDAVAVAHRPGLIGSLLIGVTAAKSLAWSLGKPLIGVDHVQAHLYSVMLRKGDIHLFPSGGAGDPSADAAGKDGCPLLPALLPAVGLVISGGHTSLYRVDSWTQITRLGSTIDDAVGEAYDKVAAILGLGYPGGPLIDKLAAEGDPDAIKFPRTLLGRESLDFSFSGLKTAVLYHVRGVPTRPKDGATSSEPTRQGGVELTDRNLRDIAAGFQAACVDVIIKKLDRAVRRTKARSVIVGGGVSANGGLRAALAKLPVPVHFPHFAYCTDNAAMSAGLADVLLRDGQTASLDLDAVTSSAIR
jgi:N6-L-threonylcarbamoyladenine synthase